jgi:hypothetical protein
MSEHSVQVNRVEDRTALVNVFVCGLAEQRVLSILAIPDCSVAWGTQ